MTDNRTAASAYVRSGRLEVALTVLLAIPVLGWFCFAAFSPATLAALSDRLERRPSFAGSTPVAQVISDTVV